MELTELEKSVVMQLRQMKPNDDFPNRRLVLIDCQSKDPLIEIPVNREMGWFELPADMPMEKREQIVEILNSNMRAAEDIVYGMIDKSEENKPVALEFRVTVIDQ